jgi:mono/diheme cytochrome c family protein
MKRVLNIAVAILFSLPLAPRAAEPSGIAFFEQKIRPVLVEHCYECHSAEAKKLKGNLFLDSKAGWQKGGDSGKPAIIPGKPEESLLIQSVRHEVEDLEMPPKKPKLPEAVIADLVTWVKMGAPDPRDGAKLETKRADKSWWSLQPLAKQFTHQSIDGFIEARLKEKGLSFSPPADPRALIRRMTYDLHGLPPTPEEVEAFCSAYDRSDQAHRADLVASLIDRLLASPRYGERWGRHWLDVTRFGESNGFERNFVIDDLWPFRDYVIRSLNDDKPFNQFITEHLAGDVIGKDQPQVEVGSAFLVAGPYDDVKNEDPVAQANIRAATLDDVITATSGAFLGLTINCARCHNHKFDPIPMEDYYRLRAAFEGVEHGRRVVATREQREAFAAATRPLNQERNRLTAEIETLEKAIEARAKAELAKRTFTRPKVDPQLTEETFPPVAARYVKFVIHAQTDNPKRAGAAVSPRAGARGTGRLTEFEVWSAGPEPRNVALAKNGAKAAGARSAVAEDFPEAYGPQFCIDGQFGEQWFIGTPAELTITLAQVETIDRIAFSNAKGAGIMNKAQGATPCEYEVQVSLDGKAWTTVASGDDRQPWSPAHGIERVRRDVITPEEESKLATLEKQLAQVQARLNRVPKLPQVWAGNFAQPKERTFVHKGGDPMKPGEPVSPASLSVLDRLLAPYELPADAPEGERRLALANWITSDSNALALRVLANRVWQYHFGVGIVDTPSDFGFLGSQPTHPELLEFLASRLLAHGWRLKPLHREIMLSRTYQQSSVGSVGSVGFKVDATARLLWRFPPRRLSAEEIRDTMLAVAGKLQLEPMGGPGFRLYKFTQNNVCTYFPLDTHGPETYRRAVYHQNARASVVDVLNDFDLPDIAFAAPKRANTTTPLQALTLLNHSFTLDMAKALAARLDAKDPIASAYRLAFQRPPTAKERAAATLLIQSHGLESFCRALLNANELIYLD